MANGKERSPRAVVGGSEVSSEIYKNCDLIVVQVSEERPT
jgi:hypothetical protein